MEGLLNKLIISKKICSVRMKFREWWNTGRLLRKHRWPDCWYWPRF